jgi:Spy/CpxP family protein refolding chaperone
MKLAGIVTAVLLLPMVLLPMTLTAQTNGAPAPGTNPQGANPQGAAVAAAPGFSLPGGLKAPAGLFDEFWNDPARAAELHLTDAQRKQLQDAALTQRLSLIDGGADALKALAHLSAILQADQLDDAAYTQQMQNLAAATGKLVQEVGEMAVSPRRVLSLEQWRKLQSLQRAKQAEKPSAAPRPSATHAPAAGGTNRDK